jgi:hypothetical protein
MSGSMEKALGLHAQNVAAFLSSVASCADSRWNEPRAEGKWSPAEVAAHLVTSYEVVIGELRGKGGLAIKTSRLQQIVLRLLFGWRILYFGRFPRGVKAPRETRPPAGLPKEVAIEQFRARAAEFETAAREAGPGQRLSHTYFGKGKVSDGVLLCARHIEHHRQQIL